jgi:hypothetical protein
MSLVVINLDTPSLGDRSYFVHDGKTALVIDPLGVSSSISYWIH